MSIVYPIHKAPYTNFHDLNLDWVIDELTDFNTRLTDFVSLATIKYADPIQWDITSQYEANTVVVDSSGNAYLSVQPVPSGVSLDRTEYWTKIGNFDALWADVKKAITPIDEGHSSTATAARAVDDLVWADGSLVRVTKAMDAGDAYVVGSNCVSSSTNEVLHYLITTFNDGLSAEQQAREEADTQLQTAITAEQQAREEADTQLKTAITAEQQAREEADTQLQNDFSTALKSVTNWANVKAYGAVGDGSTDDTAAFNEAKATGLPLYVPQGTFNVSGFVSATDVPMYIDGMIGGSITINGPIMAKNKQIFAEGASITIAKQYADGWADWFHDLQSAVDALQKVHLSNRVYTPSGNITINKSDFAMVGPEYSDGSGATIILQGNSAVIVGDVSGRTINDFPKCISIERVRVEASGTQYPVQVYGVIYGTFKMIRVVTTNNNAPGGFLITKNVSTVYNRCFVQSVNHNSPSSAFTAYYCTDQGSPVGAGGNASLYFVRCSYNDTYTDSSNFNSVGFFIQGGSSDVYIFACETASAGIGINIDGTSATKDNSFNDTIINNCVFDMCYQGGLRLWGTKQGCISISDCYVGLAPNGQFGVQFTNNDSTMYTMHGMQFVNLSGPGIAFQVVNGTPHIIGDFTAKNFTNPFSGTPDNSIINYISDGTLSKYPAV